jgi:hypothetical protein
MKTIIKQQVYRLVIENWNLFGYGCLVFGYYLVQESLLSKIPKIFSYWGLGFGIWDLLRFIRLCLPTMVSFEGLFRVNLR